MKEVKAMSNSTARDVDHDLGPGRVVVGSLAGRYELDDLRPDVPSNRSWAAVINRGSAASSRRPRA